MDWLQQVDGYCERLGPGLWAEPVNLISNLAFLLAAIALWPRVAGLAGARVLTLGLGLIGVGSALFHSFANPLTGIMDTAPIMAFTLIYIFLATRDYLGLPRLWSLAIVTAVLPAMAASTPLFRAIGIPGASAAYAPLPVLILIYATILSRRAQVTSRGLAAGAVLLILSLTFRSLDQPLCTTVPLGLHWVWHLLNAATLGWMILVYRRHMLAAGRAGR